MSDSRNGKGSLRRDFSARSDALFKSRWLEIFKKRKRSKNKAARDLASGMIAYLSDATVSHRPKKQKKAKMRLRDKKS